MRLILGLCVVFLTCLASHAIKLQCRDMQNRPVDWFIAYKLPSSPHFIYTDNATPDWVPSEASIDDQTSALGYTLNGLLQTSKNSKNDHVYAVYNDEHPRSKKTDSYRAHAKGAFAFDDFTGFWLVHSVPGFIDLKSDKYEYPGTGMRFGQTFICLSLSVTALTELGKHLETLQPSIVGSNMPDSFAKLAPALARAVGQKRPSKNLNATIVQGVETLGGANFKLFSKNRKFHKDLYTDLVAPTLSTPLFVESWLNGGAEDLASDCNSTNKVMNIRSLDLANRIQFSSAKDHSKWAVSDNPRKPFVCIGDINRQKSQFDRGGGTVCFRNATLWRIFRSNVGEVQCCDQKVHTTCP
uniref:Deoxyribonuclease II n=1 Tax=Panagrellus redivivus TaxID=6233 RepID=A0A7E4UUN8_PANRE